LLRSVGTSGALSADTVVAASVNTLSRYAFASCANDVQSCAERTLPNYDCFQGCSKQAYLVFGGKHILAVVEAELELFDAVRLLPHSPHRDCMTSTNKCAQQSLQANSSAQMNMLHLEHGKTCTHRSSGESSHTGATCQQSLDRCFARPALLLQETEVP